MSMRASSAGRLGSDGPGGRGASPGPSGHPSPSDPSHRVPDRRPGRSWSAVPKSEPPIFPARLFLHPQTILVHGPSSTLVNLTLFALAHQTNPEFQWVEIRSRNGDPAGYDPVRLGWIPDDRLWKVDQAQSLSPNDGVANLRLSELISPE